MKYVDRNGNKIVDDSSQDKLLHLLYTHMWGRVLLKPLVTPGFSGFPNRSVIEENPEKSAEIPFFF